VFFQLLFAMCIDKKKFNRQKLIYKHQSFASFAQSVQKEDEQNYTKCLDEKKRPIKQKDS